MAEVTGLRNNALPYPVYGAPYGLTFPILDADGDLVTGAAGLDAEISKNGDTFADCTNEGTEIATASGMYYLLLTATELTCDVATIIQKTSTSGAKTTPMVLYPRKLPNVRSGTAQGGAAGSITLDSGASAIDDYYNGCLVIGTLDGTVEARIITDYAGSTKVASVTPDWNTTPDSDDTFVIKLPDGVQIQDGNLLSWIGVAPLALSSQLVQVLVNSIAANAITAAAIATGAIDADAIADNAIDAGAIAADAITAAKIANGAIDASTFATGAIDAAALAADAVTEIQTGLALEATAQAILADTAAIDARLPADPADESNVLAAIAAVQADTDNLQTRVPAALVAGRMDSSVGAMAADTLTASALATDAVNEIVAAVFARAFSAAYGALTFDQIMKILVATQGAKVSGAATTTVTIRNLDDSADVVVATVDADGNRTAVTLTP